ncbi:YuiB family protein [Oceanobacillus sp. J11TS1]|uniref:YuiB family protein n=1 Tax=Oceanobacillus sp. J11TS1 TaxID=2807191 RepID=UPI001B0284F8|nr:YuiB family protein [Oceanobacillus sp. J11TS1]GIO24922.1 putative membrane protein YuiB [Oceanobacillus sp. J11TS1]
MVQLIVSVILYFVIFFGIAFILNMLLRRTWLMACLYPVIMIFVIDNISFFSYFTNTGEAFSALGDRIVGLTAADIIILLSGFIGTIVSGFVIRFLRKSGYQMF